MQAEAMPKGSSPTRDWAGLRTARGLIPRACDGVTTATGDDPAVRITGDQPMSSLAAAVPDGRTITYPCAVVHKNAMTTAVLPEVAKPATCSIAPSATRGEGIGAG